MSLNNLNVLLSCLEKYTFLPKGEQENNCPCGRFPVFDNLSNFYNSTDQNRLWGTIIGINSWDKADISNQKLKNKTVIEGTSSIVNSVSIVIYILNN